MASEVDICNIALAHLGDNASVASLDPPEGSAQAEHCARFYPIARDTLLEAHDWNFATRRARLAQVTANWEQWDYAYVQPADCLRVLAVLDPNATSDYAVNIPTPFSATGLVNSGLGMYTPQEYVCETDSQGRRLVLTNQEDAMLRYVSYVSDTTKFTPMFVTTLSWHLAAMLAGPVVKGETGRAEAKRCEAMAAAWLGKAVTSDVQQRNVKPQQSVTWIAAR